MGPVKSDDFYGALLKFNLLLLDNGAEIQAHIPDGEIDVEEIKVGPDGFGSYRYMIGKRLSLDAYHNAASAREDARKPQVVVNSQGREFTKPADGGSEK